MTHPALHTPLCDLFGVEYPIVQTGMGWVAGAAPHRGHQRAPAGSASSPSATMTLDQLATRDRAR